MFAAVGVSLVVAMVASTGMVGATTTGAPASGEPIKIGYINFLTGSFAEPTALQAEQAYIDAWNKRGGYNGQPIELVVEDAGFSAGANIAAVQKLAAQGVVGFASIGLCQSTLPIVKGLHVPVLATTNDQCEATALSPCVGKFALDKSTKGMAFVTPNFPMVEQLGQPLKRYMEANNVKFVEKTTPIVATGADFDAVVADLKGQGVDTVWTLAPTDSAVIALESANRQSFGPKDGIRWIFGPPLYDTAVAKASPAIDGIYVQLLTYPWEAKNAATKKALKTIKGKVDDTDGFAASGYDAGAALEQLFKYVNGKPTRAAIATALTKQKPTTLPLSPVKVDPKKDPVKNPSACTLVQIKDKKFVPASDFLVVPAKEYS
jgi:branched-chain amino acid transport system substrate-binding protein